MNVIVYIILGISFIVFCTLIYIIHNLYIKFLKLHAMVNTMIDSYSNNIELLSFKIHDVKMKMDIVDKNGAFSSDDEIGFAFKEIQTLIELLDNFITEFSKIDSE